MMTSTKPNKIIVPKDWTIEDWRDLHRTTERIKRRIAARHKGEKKP